MHPPEGDARPSPFLVATTWRVLPISQRHLRLGGRPVGELAQPSQQQRTPTYRQHHEPLDPAADCQRTQGQRWRWRRVTAPFTPRRTPSATPVIPHARSPMQTALEQPSRQGHRLIALDAVPQVPDAAAISAIAWPSVLSNSSSLCCAVSPSVSAREKLAMTPLLRARRAQASSRL
jgi:hypothetical protein